MKKCCLLLLLIVSVKGMSQSLNDYKYAIVPAKFGFLKEKDQYGLNTLTKLFMEKNGFETYYDTDILPSESVNNRCNRIYVDVNENDNLLVTKLTVVIKDCRNAVLFTSKEGKSREKDYHIAYNQALRDAFSSLGALDHHYTASEPSATITEKKETVVLSENFEDKPVSVAVHPQAAQSILSAQAIENGFQLVDTTPKIVLRIYKTSQPDVYMADNGAVKGILRKSNGQWLFEYYENNQLVSQPMVIKF